MSDKLPDFEGLIVGHATVRITNAGDGLSEALDIEPKALGIDDSVYYVLRGEVTQVNHRIDKDANVTRVHTVKATRITEVDRDTAEKMLQAAADQLERAKAERDGQLMLEQEAAAEERERADAASTGIARTTQTKQPSP